MRLVVVEPHVLQGACPVLRRQRSNAACLPCKPYTRMLSAALLVALCTSAYAQPVSPPAKLGVPDAKAERLEVKDDAVLIDELRVRGETKRLSVTPKNAPAYQIAPESGSKPLDDKTQGQRTWRLFSF